MARYLDALHSRDRHARRAGMGAARPAPRPSSRRRQRPRCWRPMRWRRCSTGIRAPLRRRARRRDHRGVPIRRVSPARSSRAIARRVNRLSLGVQVARRRDPCRDRRLHDARGARSAFEAARTPAAANLSVDVIVRPARVDSQGGACRRRGARLGSPITSPRTGSRSTRAVSWGAAGVEGIPPSRSRSTVLGGSPGQAAARGLEHTRFLFIRATGLFARTTNQIYWARRGITSGRTGAAASWGPRATRTSRRRRAIARRRDRRPAIDSSAALAAQKLGERLMLACAPPTACPRAGSRPGSTATSDSAGESTRGAPGRC